MSSDKIKNQDWWKGAVIYQIYPRSYQDSNGDGIGDIPGIIKRLPYIALLGVDAIWLSPIFTSPMKDMGYDVSNYYDIDSLFGTLEDFKEMVAKAHELGLKVMIDQVISHSSDQHPFFKESRESRDNAKADWYVWADPKPDGSPPNNWISIFGGSAWQWDTRRKQYYQHNFLREQPDLNFHNPDVQDYMLAVMRFWLDLGVDGFRLDTVNFYFHDQNLTDNPLYDDIKDWQKTNPFNFQNPIHSKNRPENLGFLERIRALLDEYDGRTLVGEVGEHVQPLVLMAQYTKPGRLHMAYSFEMLGPEFSSHHYRKEIEGFFSMAPDGWPCWAFSNHDVVRHVSRLGGEHDKTDFAKFMAALLLSFEGSICIYQGEELGQTDTELDFEELTDPQGIEFWPADKGRDGCRTPMVWQAQDEFGGFSNAKPWLPVKEEQLAHAADLHEKDPNSVLATYRELLALRRREKALRTGRTRFVSNDDSALRFTRGDEIFCIFNFSRETITESCADELLYSGCAKYNDRELVLSELGFAIMRKSKS